MRLDLELVRRKLYSSRTRAAAAIDAGLVTVNGAVTVKASHDVSADDVIAAGALPYVSGRGSLKLAHALDEFGINPTGMICLDIGASTGGFTEILLNRGAKKIIAVDVGTDQLIPEIKNNPKVIPLENTDIRTLYPMGDVDLVVIDVSFISLTNIIEAVSKWNAPIVIALIKPQFEVPRNIAARADGVIKKESDRLRSIDNVNASFLTYNYKNHGVIESPIHGGSGNIEFLALFVTD